MELVFSEEVCEQISKRVVELVRQRAPKRTGFGASMIRATETPGTIGVVIPPEVHYMVFQERGIKPFTMWHLEGKTIPMRGPGGSIQFRTVRGVGKRKITSRDEKGRIISSKIAWRHPGLKPKNFVRDSIKQAIEEYLNAALSQEDLSGLMIKQKEYYEIIKKIEEFVGVSSSG